MPVFMSSFDAQSLPRVRLKLENVGHTPAHDVRHEAKIEVFSDPIPDGVSFSVAVPTQGKKITLFPNHPWLGQYINDRAFTSDEIQKIRNKRCRIYIYGAVDYKDVFERKHATRFFYAVDADNKTIDRLTRNYTGDLEITFISVGDFNEAS